CLALLDVSEQVRRPGALLAHPAFFFSNRKRADPGPQLLGQAREGSWISRALHRKPADAQLADPLLTGRIVIFPGHVVEGAGREHLRRRAEGHLPGHHPAEELGASVHLETTALDDEGDSLEHARRRL